MRISDQVAEILVPMPHCGRPIYQFLEDHGGGRVSEGIGDVILRHTWNPPWTAARMTAKGRQIFGLNECVESRAALRRTLV